MNRLKQYVFILALSAIVFSACGQKEYVKTESGLEYLKVTDGSGEKPNDGEFLMINVAYNDGNGNVMFSSADRGGALPLNYVDSMFTNNGSLEEGFRLCENGDSIILKISAETIFKESFKRPLPDTIAAESIITVYMGVENIFTQEEFQTYRADQVKKQRETAEASSKEQVSIDAKIIEDYLSENGIEAKSTEDGLFYVITKEGNGEKPSVGSTVFVNYAGKLLDGTEFDSNNDGSFSFPLGQGRVIKGWDLGLALLTKGGKATLYIPSGLAYGARGAGAQIGPNSVLMFDVELVDIK